MPTPFFQRLQLEPIHVAFEEIVPASPTSARVRQRAVYKDTHPQVAPFPRRSGPRQGREPVASVSPASREGRLEAETFPPAAAFLAFKTDFRRDMDAFDAYAMINCCAALLAQMLFVDNCLKEALGRCHTQTMRTPWPNWCATSRTPTRRIRWPIQASEARFYATYFLVQTLFDKIFVGDEAIVSRDPATGQMHLTANYDFYTSYLELSNSKLITATEVEKELCYQLTTGWGDGIDVATWNALNQDYYSRSADNFFSAAYDEHLDKMLPQFPYGRARAAEDIVGAWDGVRPINFIEIGAGSGAFAVDLFLALKHQGKECGACGLSGRGAQRGHAGRLPAELPATNGPGPPRHVGDRHRRPGGIPGRCRALSDARGGECPRVQLLGASLLPAVPATADRGRGHPGARGHDLYPGRHRGAWMDQGLLYAARLPEPGRLPQYCPHGPLAVPHPVA